jgi:photosystem II stability/assembly factor-like uncharacterized protein
MVTRMIQSRWLLILYASSVLASVSTADAQMIWDVTDSTPNIHNRRFYSLSCSGSDCSVCGLEFTVAPPTPGVTILVKRSTDRGRTWSSQNTGLPVQRSVQNNFLTAIDQIDSLNVAAVGDTALIIRTTDGGSTWHQQVCPTPSILLAVHFSDSLTGIITGTRPPVILTTMDAGAHWKQANTLQENPAFSCHSYGGGKFSVFGARGMTIFSTTDNWATVDTGNSIPVHYIDTNHIVDLEKCIFGEGDTVLAYGAMVVNGIGVSNFYGLIDRSTDQGAHWESFQRFENIFPNITSVSSIDNDTIYAGSNTSEGKILLSTNWGASWTVDTLVFSTDIRAEDVRGIATMADGSVVAAMAETPFLDNSFMARGHVEESNVQMYERIIYGTHLYPNPATSAVTIKSVEVSRPVSVVDVLGRVVLRHTLSEQGETTFDVSSLPRGIYMLQLDYYRRILGIGKIVLAGSE